MKMIPKNIGGKRVACTCKRCRQSFEALAIHVRRGGGVFCSGLCHQSYRHEHKLDEKRQNILYQKRFHYGLTEEAYLALFTKQDNKCAICAVSFAESRAHVDHCHETGKVRGLLCNHCNTAIGMMRDNISLLKRAMDYITNHPLCNLTR